MMKNLIVALLVSMSFSTASLAALQDEPNAGAPSDGVCSITINNDAKSHIFVELSGQTDFEQANLGPGESHQFKGLACGQRYGIYGHLVKKVGNFSVTYQGITYTTIKPSIQSFKTSQLDLRKEIASGQISSWPYKNHQMDKDFYFGYGDD